MTQSSRELHIAQSLAEYARQTGVRDTLRVPLRGGQSVEVIEIPLELPLLNTESFRIAPALADHPNAALVRDDPESPEAQRLVARLVRDAHRKAAELKESLVDGQDQPGVITRKGKLLNANTRCVLLRELWQEGTITRSTIRVGVLPADVTEAEELQLESVLQRQREHKDEYNLPGELMMLRKLHDDAGMSDAQIAKQLRVRGGAARVGDLRSVLGLMERARHLADPPLPLSEFISEQDRRQNWLELHGKVRDVDRNEGRESGDREIRRWLIASILGESAVHRLRHAKGTWVEDDVLSDLAESKNSTATAIVQTATSSPTTDGTITPAEPDGLDFLGPEPEMPTNGDPVKQILDLVIATRDAGDGDVTLPTGTRLPAPDVQVTLAGSVKRSLDAAKRRADAGSRLQRPGNLLTEARKSLKDAADALDDVVDEPGFAQFRVAVGDLADEVSDLLDRVMGALQIESVSESNA